MRITTLTPVLALAIAASLAGCDQQPAGDVEVQTIGGHILDSRGWAVGSNLGVSAYSSTARQLRIGFESPDGDEIVTESWNSSTAGGGFDMWDMMDMMNPMGGGWADAEVDVIAEGDIDVVVLDGRGNELERIPLEAKPIADYELGIVLDDCPEFADLVIRDDNPAFLAGSEITFMPAPLDDQGQHLIGHVDWTVDSSDFSLDSEYGWGGYEWMGIDESGSMTLTLDGESKTFTIDAIETADLVSLEIVDLPEKHGIDNQSLLCAIGRTADGREVHGIDAEWNSGWTSQTIHADDNEMVEACFGDLCASWAGPSY